MNTRNIATTLILAAGLVCASCAEESTSNSAATTSPAAAPALKSSLGEVRNARAVSESVVIADVVPARPSTEAVAARYEHPTGLVIEDLRLGDGDVILPGAFLVFRHRAFLPDGTQFEESYVQEQPAKVLLSKAMRGIREGMPGARVGGKRRLVIPSGMAFGMFGRRQDAESEWIVPPDTDVIFEIEALESRVTLTTSGSAEK